MTSDLLLSHDEARVLGVLIEKSMTTPEQYPLSLNALVNGCNQKSNRNPVLDMESSEVRAALKGLRDKQLAVEIWPAGGGRTEKYRHCADTTLGLDDKSIAVIGELLLRRAQMPGEVRARASRMSTIETQGDLRPILDDLMAKGMVVQLPPAPGSRTERYDHSLCADASDLSMPQESPRTQQSPAAPQSPDSLSERLAALEARVAALEAQLSDS